MAITYPVDLLAGFPGSCTRFVPVYMQELSPTRGGDQNTADLGPTLWEADYQSNVLKPTEHRKWKARLNSLENGKRTFKGYELLSCFPLAYPNGSWPGGSDFDGEAFLQAVNGTNYRQMRLGGLPPGYVISEGDYLSFAYGDFRALHQSLETVTTAGTGITQLFEVTPSIRPGDALDDAVVANAPVQLLKPHATMILIPGTVQTPASMDGRGTVSFSARQTISASDPAPFVPSLDFRRSANSQYAPLIFRGI